MVRCMFLRNVFRIFTFFRSSIWNIDVLSGNNFCKKTTPKQYASSSECEHMGRCMFSQNISVQLYEICFCSDITACQFPMSVGFCNFHPEAIIVLPCDTIGISKYVNYNPTSLKYTNITII